jgi:hypothetical protein
LCYLKEHPKCLKKKTEKQMSIDQVVPLYPKKQKKSKCDCPLRRSAGSVDSLIDQVRAIFRDLFERAS